jgi:prolyl 4-hydroxylase
VLSWKPRALLYPNFASKQQCEAIIKLARTHLAPSGLALRKGETEDTTKEIRTRWVVVVGFMWIGSTVCQMQHASYFVRDAFKFLLWWVRFEGSSGTFLRAEEDKTRSLLAVEEKMARATMIPRMNGEVCIIQR